METANRHDFITTTTASALPLKSSYERCPVVHHVFFWLKNPGSKEDKDKLVNGLKTLSAIETVRDVRIGVVATTEKRDVVDNSWSVSELIFFSDLAGQVAYQNHPIHLEFVNNCGHLWEKVIVYDAIDA